eukprot:6517407-Pyramimonas_sp.AAC.3
MCGPHTVVDVAGCAFGVAAAESGRNVIVAICRGAAGLSAPQARDGSPRQSASFLAWSAGSKDHDRSPRRQARDEDQRRARGHVSEPTSQTISTSMYSVRRKPGCCTRTSRPQTLTTA